MRVSPAIAAGREFQSQEMYLAEDQGKKALEISLLTQEFCRHQALLALNALPLAYRQSDKSPWRTLPDQTQGHCPRHRLHNSNSCRVDSCRKDGQEFMEGNILFCWVCILCS